jgi:hypothetical protein
MFSVALMGLWSLAGLLTLALLNRRDPIRVPDQYSTRRIADILGLRRVWPKCAFLKFSRPRGVYTQRI